MSNVRTQTFGELRDTLRLLQESTAPQNDLTLIEQMEEVVTQTEINSLLSPFHDDDVITAGTAALFRNYLQQRWERIRKHRFMNYQHNTVLFSNRACMALAEACQLPLGQNIFLLLIPSLAATDSLITGSDLSEGKLCITDLVLSDDEQHFIEVKECLDFSLEDGILRHTQKLDNQNQPIKLSGTETTRVIHACEETIAYNDATQKRVKFSTANTTLGACVNNLVTGLVSGGQRNRGSEYNAGADANLAIFNFAEIYNGLPANIRNDLDQMHTNEGTDHDFHYWWNILAIEQFNKIERINSNRNLSQTERREQLEVVHRATSTCVEVSSGRIQAILNFNRERLFAIRLNDNSMQESILALDAERLRCEQNVPPALKLLATTNTYRSPWIPSVLNIITAADYIKNYCLAWLGNTSLVNFKTTMNILLESIPEFQQIFTDHLLPNLNAEQKKWCVNAHLHYFVSKFPREMRTRLLAHQLGELSTNNLLLAMFEATSIVTADQNLPALELLLLLEDIDINFAGTTQQHTPLMSTCMVGNSQFARILLDHPSILINTINHAGDTALHHAARSGYLDMVKLLIERGADLTICNTDGMTALGAAVICNNLDTIRLLLSQPSQPVNEIHSNGQTLLENVITTGLHTTDIPALLMQRGAELNIGQEPRTNALMIAVTMDLPLSFINTLLATNINIDAIDPNGNTALILAVLANNESVVRALIAKGANTAIINQAGKDVIAAAIEMRNANFLELFINNDPVKLQEVLSRCLNTEDGAAVIQQLLIPASPTVQAMLSSLPLDHFKQLMGYILTHSAITTEELFQYNIINMMNDEQLAWCVNTHPAAFAPQPDFDWQQHLINLASQAPKDTEIQLRIARLRATLLIEGVDINARVGASLTSALIEACKAGSLPIIEYLLNRPGININEVDILGNSAVMLTNSIPVIELLIRKGANITLNNTSGHSLLIMAAKTGKTDLAALLLNITKRNIDYQDRLGNTALMHAVMQNNERLITLLISQGASIDITNSNNQNALMLAVERGSLPITTALLKQSTLNIDHINPIGQTALSLAVSAGHVRIATLLIANGADVDLPDNTGKRVLDIAMDAKNAPMIELLLMPKSPLDLQKLFSSCMLRQPINIDMIQQLVLRRVNVNVALGNGEIPLTLAARIQSEPLIRALLPATEQLGLHAVAQCVDTGDTDAIRLICSTGMKMQPNRCPNINTLIENKSLLLKAVENNDVRTVQCLLQLGANPHVLIEGGQTVLRIAAANGQTEIVNELLRNHAHHEQPLSSLNNCDNNGNTALMLAATYGHTETVACLLEHGAKVKIGNGELKLPQQQPVYRNEIALLIAKKLLETYRDQRAEEGRWTGSLFGSHKESKIRAVNAVLALIESTPEGTFFADHLMSNLLSLYENHRRALNQGELGKLFHEILDTKSNMPAMMANDIAMEDITNSKLKFV